MKTSLFLLLICFGFSSCNSVSGTAQPNKVLSDQKLEYLALGDSYTIGESVSEAERWPNQLVRQLKDKGCEMENPQIIAQTGWRTDELLSAMDRQLGEKRFDLVSVLIGVNNQYQGKEVSVFEQEFQTLLQQAIKKSKNGKKSVFVLSIPDYGVTPFGVKSGKENINREIDLYNSISKKICEDYKIQYFNITDISRRADADSTLIAKDGLHPSGEMYRQWAEMIAPKISRMLQK